MTILERYLNYITAEQALSAATVDAYRRDLKAWIEYLSRNAEISPEEFDPALVTAADIRVYIASLTANSRSRATVRRHLQAIRSFYRFLLKTNQVKANPAADITTARLNRTLPVFIDPAETAAVLDNAADYGDDFIAIRDSLMVDIFYSTGIRESELISLRIRDIDLKAGELKVLGKRNKHRIVPFGPALGRAIDSYLTVRQEVFGTAMPDDPLLVRTDGKPLYRSLVYRVIHRRLSDAGVHARRLSPHVLRHSFATDMLNNGAGLNTVAGLLGHESLSTTQIYTHVTLSDMQHNYQLAHPRAQKRR
ncbi:MAG: tyrosine-type recombinase/integrase [Muribaculaceae bacterium]|nr:tyrosine-type recombinase/integrase [Muribaculaceae bacterium]